MLQSADPQAPPVRRRLGFRLVGLLLGLTVGLLLAEGLLRVFDLGTAPLVSKRYLIRRDAGSRVDYQCYPTNPHGEFAAPPDLTGNRWRLIDYVKREYPLSAITDTPYCVEYQVSSSRLRDREHALEPAAGVLRIAIVGDSFVYGEGVPQRLTLVDQMSARLGDHYELLNGGHPGSDTRVETNNSIFLTRTFHCPRLIVVFTANDVSLNDELQRRATYINDLINVRDLHLRLAEQRTWFIGESRLLRLAGSRLLMRGITDQTIQWYLDSYRPELNGANLEQMASDFRTLAMIPNCQGALVLYPLLEGLEGKFPLAPIHARVSEMARQAGLPVLDLAPVFAGQTSRDLWAHDCDHHPNGTAHRQAAEAIIAWLRRDVPGFLDAP